MARKSRRSVRFHRTFLSFKMSSSAAGPGLQLKFHLALGRLMASPVLPEWKHGQVFPAQSKCRLGADVPQLSTIPLQSGSSSSPGSALAAGSSDFFIEFNGAVLQKQFPNRRIVQHETVRIHQAYHIVRIFDNPVRASIFDRMAIGKQKRELLLRGAGGDGRQRGHGVF